MENRCFVVFIMIIKIKVGVIKMISYIWLFVFVIKCWFCLKMGKYCIYLFNFVVEFNFNLSFLFFWEVFFVVMKY